MKQALEIRKSMIGETSIGVAECYESMAETYLSKMDYGYAIEYFEKSLFVYGKCYEGHENLKSKELEKKIKDISKLI